MPRSTNTNRPRRKLPFVAALAALTLTAAAPAAAQAAVGDAHIYLGSTPAGAPAKVGPWSGLTINSPSGTGTFGINMGNVSQGYSATAALGAPLGTSITAATANYSYDAGASGNHSQPQINTSFGNFGHPYQDNGSGGYSSQSGSGTASASGNLSMQVACVNFDGVAGSCGSGASFQVSKLDLTVNDANGSTITGTMTGGLVDGTWQTGTTASVAVTAADQGLGAYRAWIKDGASTYYALLDPDSTTCKDVNTANVNDDATLTADLGTPARVATKRHSAALAFPSTGGAATRMTTTPSRSPTTSVRLARGWTRTASRA